MFGIGSKILAYIGGGAAALLAIALIVVTLTKNAEIRTLNNAIEAPRTGWRARLDACNLDKQTLRANQGALEASLAKQNSLVSDLSQQSANKYYAGQADRAEAAKIAYAAQSKDKLLQSAKAGADIAKSADDLILESLQ